MSITPEPLKNLNACDVFHFDSELYGCRLVVHHTQWKESEELECCKCAKQCIKA